jgi:quinol-cytochrome oxidoreductase complex cytochrome b subunit
MDGSSETAKTFRYPSIPVRKNETVSVLIGQRLLDKNEPMSSREKHHLRPYFKLGNIAAFIGTILLFLLTYSTVIHFLLLFYVSQPANAFNKVANCIN